MRILLIYPRTRQSGLPKPSLLPLGLSFIASLLRKKGHAVSIFDRFSCQARIGTDKEKIDRAMLEDIKEFRPDLIGLNTLSPLIFDTVESVALIRKTYPGLLVAGGHHVSALPDLSLLKMPGLNGVVEGEGEIPMAKIAEGEPSATIPGIWWKDKEGLVAHTPPKRNENLDQLPFPALDLLDLAFYSRPNLNSIPGHYLSALPILTSRGCSHRCDYCCEPLTLGSGVRYHSPDYVIEWMKQVRMDYNVEGVYCHDSDFLINEHRAREICERIISVGLHKQVKWAIQTRADRIHGEILKLLKRAGCVLVELGVESSSQNQLDSVHKGTTVSVNEQAMTLCHKAGLAVEACMMTGFEGEVPSDLEERLSWVKKVKPNTFYWFPLMIHPGTLLYETKGNHFFEENEWTEENIVSYYRSDFLSSIVQRERDLWMKRHYAPYHKRHRRLNLLKVNKPVKLFALLGERARSFFLQERWAEKRERKEVHLCLQNVIRD